MEHVRMVAQSPFDYAERRVHKGQEFDCDPKHAKLLKIVGKASYVEEAKKDKPEPKKKRTYRRRDMRAE